MSGRAYLCAAGLFLLVLALFSPALGNGFVDMDDGLYITSNPHVLGGLTLRSLAWAFTTHRTGNWAPLTWASHMLDVSLFGVQPWGHHLTSLLLHAGTAALALLALTLATGELGRSFAVTLLFAIHPLRVESVAWAAERKDVLCIFFCAATLLQYVHYRRRATAPRYGVLLALFACALMAKAMAVTLPCVLLLLDFWPLGVGKGWRERVREKLPLFALAAAASVATTLFQRAEGAMQSLAQVSLLTRAQTVPQAYFKLLSRTLWPTGLYFPYLRTAEPGWLELLEALLLCGALLFTFLYRRRWPSLFVGAAWFFGMLVPTVSLIQVGPQLTADRFTYLPHLGLFTGVAFALPPLAQRFWRLAWLVFGAVCGVLASVTLEQLTLWRDSEAFFTHGLAVDPGNEWLQVSLGIVRLRQGRPEQARALFEQALEKRSVDGFVWSCLAAAELDLHRPDRALAASQKGVELAPADGEIRLALGRSLMALHQREAGVVQLREARRLAPDSVPITEALVSALGVAGRPQEALVEADQGLTLAPDDPALWFNRGVALGNLGRLEEAQESLERALALNPSDSTARALLERIRRDARAKSSGQ